MTHESDPQPSSGGDLISGARRQVAAGSVDRAGAHAGEASGDVIDRYTLLQEIGEGGMGTVWMAQQTEPVRRRVALKIIKLGMDTKEVVVRFEAERQALALMDHPHIAKVLDGGATENGRPYFAMELVKGVPITEFCDNAKMGLRERLELFAKVCEAIQHAHHKGVIHRDIKPNNVLVSLQDGVPQPKVIDFGIAKATSAELTQKTMFTQYAAIIGTPEYMAPEQAEMSGLDIDTRADVYSLGVLLYELLTGTKPFDIKTALEAGYQELLRTIREVDPAKPSTRVSTLRETRTADDLRHVNVESLSRRLRGDLDWIVMKALEKDRTRRYDTPNALAVEIGRYLTGEPVSAAPPGAAYRLRKFVARRKRTVAAAATIAVLLVAGSVGTGLGWWNAAQANEALDVALVEKSQALEREEELRVLAQAKEAEARTELQRAETITQLMHELLRGVAPQQARGADVEPFKRVLDDAARRLDAGEIEDPFVRSQVQQIVGGVYQLLGLYEQAEKHLVASVEGAERLLDAGDSKLGLARIELGKLRMMQGDYDEAERQFRLAYDALTPGLEPGHPLALRGSTHLAMLVNLRGRQPEALAILLPDESNPFEYDYSVVEHRLHAQSLALTYAMMGRIADADRVIGALRAGCEVEGNCRENDLTVIREVQASIDAMAGRDDAAAEASAELSKETREAYGEDHPEEILRLVTRGEREVRRRRYEKAEGYLTEALERATRVMGPTDEITLGARHKIARMRQVQERYDEAEALHEAVLADVLEHLGPGHALAETIRADLALVYNGQGRNEEAIPLLEAILEQCLATLPADHVNVLGGRTNLANAYNDVGRFADAAEQCEISLPAKRATLGEGHQFTQNARGALAAAYEGLGRHEESLALLREWFEIQFRSSGAHREDAPPGTKNAAAWYLLTSEHVGLRDPERALRLATEECARDGFEKDPDRYNCLDTLAAAQFATGDPAAAAESQQRAVDALPDKLPDEVRAEFESKLETYREAAK